MKKTTRFIYFLFLIAAISIPLASRPAPKMVMLGSLSGDKPDFLQKRIEGKRVILNFWASYCEPCKKEMPELQKLVDEEFPDIELIYINTDPADKRELVEKQIKERNITKTVLLDTYQAAVQQYTKAAEVPATFLINEKGEIKMELIGFYKDTINRLRMAVSAMKREKK
jgi:thiol-disulfide isomerase/thioredoxin